MEFNALILKQLLPVLREYGFKVVNELHNIVQFQSPIIGITISYNNRENSFLVEVGKIGKDFYPLSDMAIRDIYNLEIHIEHVNQDDFIKNLLFLLKQPQGIQLLRGDLTLKKNNLTM